MKALIFILFITFFTACIKRSEKQLQEEYKLTNHQKLRYDTLEGEFLYEVFIEPYLSGDAFVKSNNLIGSMPIAESYRRGYYVFNPETLRRLKRLHDLSADSSSVGKFYSQISRSNLLEDLNGNKKIYSPMKGLYYRKYKMKFVALYLGENRQIIPKISDNKEPKLAIDKKYKISTIPTYLITDMFSVKEVDL